MAIQRTLSGLALTAVILASIFIAPLRWIMPVIIVAGAILGIFEFCGIASRKGLNPNPTLGVLFTVALLADGYFFNLSHFLPIVIGAVALAGLIYTLFLDHEGSISGVATTLFGGLWVGLSMTLGMMIFRFENGPFILGLVMAMVFLTDVGAYAVGCNLGRHKLCPRLSPNKTLEGAVGGFFFSLLSALVVYLILGAIERPIFPLYEILLLGAFFGMTGQIGDLIESGFKRDAGVKDSGKTRTGHGGILDLTDSLLFCLPLMYLYLLLFPR